MSAYDPGEPSIVPVLKVCGGFALACVLLVALFLAACPPLRRALTTPPATSPSSLHLERQVCTCD